MCLEMVLLQEITEARMDGKAFHRRKRLHTPSDLTSSAKYREVKRAAEDHKQWWRQRSKKTQVISRSENPPVRSPRWTFFLKKVDNLFLVVPSKHRPPMPFRHQNKTNKAVRYGGNIFTLCSHYYRSNAIHRARQGGARAVDLPGHLICRTLV